MSLVFLRATAGWLLILLLASPSGAYAFVWQHEQRLYGADLDPNGGYASALDVDGGRLVAGKPFDSHAGLTDAGAAFAYERRAAAWVLEQPLLAPDNSAGDSFGFSVAVSGDTLAVGAPKADLGGQLNEGAVYLFSRVGGAWVFTVKLDGGAATDASDQFGYAVELSGDDLIVGAPFAVASGQARAGRAFVFHRTAGVWSLQQALAATPVVGNDSFGASVAIDGERALVGIHRLLNTGFVPSGIAHAFARAGAVWSQETTFASAAPAPQDRFGSVLVLDGARALIGSPGGSNAAYAFNRSTGTWLLEGALSTSGGNLLEFAGGALALEGTTALVGAPLGTGTVAGSGRAYAFNLGVTGWVEAQTLDAPAPSGAYFGGALALAGDDAIVGAPEESWGNATAPGIGWAFQRTAGIFARVHVLVPEQPSDEPTFGRTVALHQTLAAVSRTGGVDVYRDLGNAWVHDAYFSNASGGYDFGIGVDVWGESVAIAQTGAMSADPVRVYVREPDGDWGLEGQLEPLVNVDGSSFGRTVDLEGDRVAVTANRYPGGTGHGRVYVFERSGSAWDDGVELAGPAPAADLNFGDNVSLSGNRLAIDEAGAGIMFNQAGRVHAFVRTGSTWAIESTTFAPTPAAGDAWGRGLALEDDSLLLRGVNGFARMYGWLAPAWLVGLGLAVPPPSGLNNAELLRRSTRISGLIGVVASPEDSGAPRPGDVRTFESDGAGGWLVGPKLAAPSPADDDEFGRALALDGNALLVSASRPGGGATGPAVAYVLRTSGNTANPSDLDFDTFANYLDVCARVFDPSQTDSGGLAAPGSNPNRPDGIGDACACGDVDGDGRVEADDAGALLRLALAAQPARAFQPELCSVIGPIDPSDDDHNLVRDDCDVLDWVVLRRALDGLSPGIAPNICVGQPES